MENNLALKFNPLKRSCVTFCPLQFSDEFLYERKDFLKLIDEGKLLFNQLPLLEIDGKNLIQSGSTARYLGRKAGLCGKNEDEAVQIDMLFEGGRDFFTPILAVGFRPEADVLAEVKSKSLPKYMPLFEKVAAANGTGYLVGSSMTLADLSLLEPLLAFVEYFGSDIFNDYPALKKFYDTLTSVDTVSAFLKGPHRQRKNDEKYVKDVKTVLAW
ncbi:glutathione s-transferase-like protein [Plakobranchus ocellatus]|uniref:Glutathione s-transferase-like protein n=1 Tax=Plakobranchus ocellatus TaxID=259542 RepID=A0AAV4BND3_9GAST|nr:glutathione s-transferase-like protein [Plakobranchus ocellatus]